jgi:hypothetical protein
MQGFFNKGQNLASVTAGSSYSKTYTYTVPSTMNAKNLRVVAFINTKDGATPTLSAGTEILNARGAKVLSAPLSTSNVLPTAFSIGDVYPNPTQDLCAVDFYLPKDVQVNAYVTDLLGNLVNKLSNGTRIAGKHTIMWSGNNNTNAEKMPAGMYFVQVNIDGKVFSKRVVMQ